jgi:hypothetical protein
MPLIINKDRLKKAKMRPELEIVLRSARLKSPENEERIKELIGGGVNWSEFLACSIQHKLTPAVYKAIQFLDADLLEQDQRNVLAEVANIQSKNNLMFLSEMLRLQRLFVGSKIPAIPFKGPALAWLAYPNFAQRSCVDLDFVVPQRYIPEVVALLKAAGFIPLFPSREAEAGEDGPAPGQYAFAPGGKGSHVEFHTERTLRYFSQPLNLEEMNSRLVSMEIGGETVRTFSVEDLLVMLCVHGAKHFWERFAWIVDISQLITVQNVNWTLLFEIAKKMECTRLLLLGLYLAHDMVGASLPQSVLDRARGDANVQWLADQVLAQYEGNSDAGIGVWPRAVFRLRSSDGYFQGLRRLIRLGMSPTESDRQTIHLPSFLSPLYSFIRPIRLLGEYGLGLARRSKPDLAIFLPTPQEIVEEMLRLAEVAPGDVLYDLGCGDGRIVVTAAKKFGIRAVGVDINPVRIAEARANARKEGVSDQVQFILGDAKKADFKQATVITMYLGVAGNLRLADQLRSQLQAGTRIVSHDFQIYGWKPDRAENRVMSNGARTWLFLWTIKNPVGTTAASSRTGASR